MQHASTTLTRHTLVFAEWKDGAALGGLEGAWRRGGGTVEGCLQHRHSGYGLAPKHTHTLTHAHAHTHAHRRISRACMSTILYACLHVDALLIDFYAPLSVYMCVYTHAQYALIYMFCGHIHTYIYISEHISIYIFVYIYTHIYLPTHITVFLVFLYTYRILMYTQT